MNELALLNSNQIANTSTADLKKEFARTLKVTSEYLVYMSIIWAELNNRGVDLTGLRSGLMEYVPLIAANKLDASLVIEFAGNKTLLSALARLPIQQQQNIAKTKKVPFIQDIKGEFKEIQLDLRSAKAADIYQVFGGATGFREPEHQIKLLKNRKEIKDIVFNKKPTLKKVSFDESKDYMLVGANKVKIEIVLDALNEEFGVDLYEFLGNYSTKIKNIK
jgi:hypothetical protein